MNDSRDALCARRSLCAGNVLEAGVGVISKISKMRDIMPNVAI